MKKILAIILMTAVLVCPAFASGEAAPAAGTQAAAAPAATSQAVSQAECNHEFEVEITEASTCTEKGLLTYSCPKCGLTYTVETVPTGHTPSAAAPTCADAVVCTVCGAELAPATGHTYSYQYDAVKDETGAFTSFGTWKCDVCGDVVDATEGNAVYYSAQQEAAAASGEASGASSEEAPAEEAVEVANPDYDPAAHNWGTIELVMVIIILAVFVVLMLSFGKRKPATKKED